MKNVFKQILLICLVITSVVAIGLFAACDKDNNSDTTVTYTVTVEDDAHNPVKGVKLNFIKGGTRYDAVTTDDDGKATMELAPDTYDIRLVAATLPDGYNAPANIQVTKDNTSVTVTLEKQFRYVVKLVNEDNTPFYYENVTLAICQLDGSCLTPSPLGEGGIWSFAGADPGDYKVQIQFPEEIDGLYTFEGSDVGHYYTGKNFSATETEMTITVKAVSTQITLTAAGEKKITVKSAAEYATVNFAPTQTGVYKISSEGSFDTRVEYSPSIYFFNKLGEDDDSGEGKNFELGGIEFQAVGQNAQFRIYVKDGATFPAIFNVKIVRTGNAAGYTERQYTTVTPAEIGSEHYGKGEGVFTYIDLSKAHTLVKAGGVYHIGTADGPVLVAKLSGSFRNNFGHFTDEFSGGFYVKLVDTQDETNGWDYCDFWNDYVKLCNSDGVYPVNDEIMRMLQRWATVYINAYTVGLSSLGTIANGNNWLIPCGYYDEDTAPEENDVIVGEYTEVEEGWTLTVNANGTYAITSESKAGIQEQESGTWAKNSENNYTFTWVEGDDTGTYTVTRDSETGKLTFTDSGETVYEFEVPGSTPNPGEQDAIIGEYVSAVKGDGKTLSVNADGTCKIIDNGHDLEGTWEKNENGSYTFTVTWEYLVIRNVETGKLEFYDIEMDPDMENAEYEFDLAEGGSDDEEEPDVIIGYYPAATYAITVGEEGYEINDITGDDWVLIESGNWYAGVDGGYTFISNAENGQDAKVYSVTLDDGKLTLVDVDTEETVYEAQKLVRS